MLKLQQAILVEGKYDKIKLSNLVDTEIFVSNGFGIFKDKEKMALLRAVAQKRGLIVFTDPDGAGLVIRNRIRQALPQDQVLHAYIPEVSGKEKRKQAPSKAGYLGVEGVKDEMILSALQSCGATTRIPGEKLTKADLAALGLSGGVDSGLKRVALQQQLGLPKNLSANALLQALNALYTKEEFLKNFS